MTAATDRELLELAAKAAGIESVDMGDYGLGFLGAGSRGGRWNPLTDDGDALRLAVRLGMSIEVARLVAIAWFRPAPGVSFVDCTEEITGDPFAATRRAIVRAAAEIGRRQP